MILTLETCTGRNLTCTRCAMVVTSEAHARATLGNHQSIMGAGASDLGEAHGCLFANDGTFLGHFSYNLRFWAAGTGWSPIVADRNLAAARKMVPNTLCAA